MQVPVTPVRQNRVMKPCGSQPACSKTGLPKAWDRTELWARLFILSLEETQEPPWASTNVDLVVPDVCPTSSQNLKLRSSISFSVQSTKHSVFFPSLSCFFKAALRTQQVILSFSRLNKLSFNLSWPFARFITPAAAFQTHSMPASLSREE